MIDATLTQQNEFDAHLISQSPQQGASLSSSALSSAQQRLWFLNQLEPDNPSYNIHVAIRITGSLNVAALEKSVNEILRRHEALRSSFPMKDGQPLQVIAPVLSLTVPVVDLSELPEPEQEVNVQQLATEEATKPFDLAQSPLLRITLLRLGEHKQVLLVTLHQIVADSWSVAVFFRELETLYEIFSCGTPSLLPELPNQYRDFVDWQQQWLHSEELQTQLAYWKQQLASASPVLELPSDRPRSPNLTGRSGRQSLELPKALTEALKVLSEQEGGTLFMTLLAAFKVLLYRYTAQEDMIVGSPIPGRNRVESEGLIGLFINTLVLRTNLSSNPSFRELLARVREVTRGAYARQDLPFEKLIEEVQPDSNLDHHPLFQVMFALQDAPLPAWELQGLTVRSLEVERGTTTNLDLTVELKETSDGFQGCFEYNTDLFEAATIARMTGHFRTLLEGIVANPDEQLSDLPLLTAAERHQLLVEWNNTQVDYSKAACIHQLFEAQVERTPDAVALVFEDKQLTYRELNTRANQLAHHLQALGVKPDVLVALCVERSLEMVIGLLGILKAGGGYVPLDPAYPPERVSFMLSDAQVPVLLTQKTLVSGLPEHEARVICLDTDWEVISQESKENPESDVTGDNLAYVIYTSGSTGKPKGVQLCHQSVTNFLHSMGQQPGLTDQDILLAVTTISFDIAVLELYLPLITGAKVVLVSREVASNGVKLLEQLVNGITIMQATPATWRLLLAAGWEAQTRIKILCGGEAMPRELANQLLERSTSLWNVYGPTETTVWSTAYKVEASRLARSKDAPESIGRPIANTQIYILDAHLQPVPIGVPGELHIGGDGLARGYLNRPELTEEKFIPDPFSNELGARLYKTGDLARYLPDGNIDYISRIDHQVKIRGFRIELGEIEAVLAQHPAVQQAVVIAREDVPGDKRLVAYWVPKQEQTSTTTELRSFVKEQLTDYMVPSAFVKLESLPLTPNGKVDRRALPAPDTTRDEAERTLAATRNAFDVLEFQLIKIWEEILGIEPIGIKDNFFELGGHSLQVMRLVDRINEVFGKNLPVRHIFEAPTIEQLADLLRQEGWSGPWRSLVTIQPDGSKPPLFCMHELSGSVVFCQRLARYLPDQPMYGLQPLGLDGKQAPHTKIEEMAAHYIKEIQTIQPNGPYFLGGYSLGGMVAFEMAQQLQAQGQKVALLAMLDTRGRGYLKTSLRSWILYQVKEVLLRGPNYILDRVKVKILGRVKAKISDRVKVKISDRVKQEAKPSPDPIKVRLLEVAKYLRLDANNSLDQNILSVMEASLQAEKDYVPQLYQGRVDLFRASLERAPELLYLDPQLGWGKLAVKGLEIHDVPSLHRTMFEEPQIQVLAEKLRTCLDKAQAAKEVAQKHTVKVK